MVVERGADLSWSSWRPWENFPQAEPGASCLWEILEAMASREHYCVSQQHCQSPLMLQNGERIPYRRKSLFGLVLELWFPWSAGMWQRQNHPWQSMAEHGRAEAGRPGRSSPGSLSADGLKKCFIQRQALVTSSSLAPHPNRTFR